MALITSSDIGTASTGWKAIGGDKFQAADVVFAYNRARLQLYSAIDRSFTPDKKAAAIPGDVVTKTDLSFSSGVATLSTIAGYIKSEYLTDASGNQITILPVSQIQQAKGLETATNRMVFDYGTSLSALTGSTNVTDGSDYILRYYGITQYTTDTATDASTVESFNDVYHPIIIELAVAIANKQGTDEIDAMAMKLIGGM
jgi:hypothetical protein